MLLKNECILKEASIQNLVSRDKEGWRSKNFPSHISLTSSVAKLHPEQPKWPFKRYVTKRFSLRPGPRLPKQVKNSLSWGPLKKGKSWPSSLYRSHSAYICWADHHRSWIGCTDQIQLKGGASQICGWDQRCWDGHGSDWRRKVIGWKNIIEFLLKNFYWMDDLVWSGKA